MRELENVLVGDSAHARPATILEGFDSDAAHRPVAGAPRTIYEELWHIAFWQQVTLDWVRGIVTPYPLHASDGLSSSPEESHLQALTAPYVRLSPHTALHSVQKAFSQRQSLSGKNGGSSWFPS